jgi:hypothetical protein
MRRPTGAAITYAPSTSHAVTPRLVSTSGRPHELEARVEDRARRGREARIQHAATDQRLPEEDEPEAAGGDDQPLVPPHPCATASSG